MAEFEYWRKREEERLRRLEKAAPQIAPVIDNSTEEDWESCYPSEDMGSWFSNIILCVMVGHANRFAAFTNRDDWRSRMHGPYRCCDCGLVVYENPIVG